MSPLLGLSTTTPSLKGHIYSVNKWCFDSIGFIRPTFFKSEWIGNKYFLKYYGVSKYCKFRTTYDATSNYLLFGMLQYNNEIYYE